MIEPTTPRKMFVYGTLMKGFYNYDKSIAGQELSMVPARTRGRVWHMTERGYPAMLEGDGWVYGELVELRDFGAMIDILDDIEGYLGPDHPENEYDRLVWQVENLETGETEEAYVYRYALDDLNAADNPVVELLDGNWRKYMEENEK